MKDLLLYGAWRSTCTHRVLLALRHYKSDFRYIPVNLDAREQEGGDFIRINEAAQVPVLVNGEFMLSQSMAIIAYLDSQAADTRQSLFPPDGLHRALAMEVAERIGSFLQPFVIPGGVRRLLIETLSADLEPAKAEAALGQFVRKQMTDSLGRLDRRISEFSGRYCVGDAVSIADVFLVPQLVGAARLGADVNGFPTLSRIYETCISEALFKAADPRLLPDAPTERPAGASHGPKQAGSAAPASTAPGQGALSGAADAMTTALSYKEPNAILAKYLETGANKPLPQLHFVRSETARRFGPVATKVTALEVCLFLRWLAQATNAKRAIEIGVFTGSSSLALLDGMGPEGFLEAIDISADYTEVAVKAWERAGFQDRGRLRISDAVEGLRSLAAEAGAGHNFDLAYVDGSNLQYRACYEALLPLMRRGGIMVFDNVLWKGRVASGDIADPSSVHLRALNEGLKADQRVETAVISLGDGLALCVVR